MSLSLPNICSGSLNKSDELTLSRPVPHSVICVCRQPFPPVRPHTAGLYCFPFFTNTCSMPTWWPARLWRNDRHRLPSFQGGVRGRTSRAPRPVRLLPTSGMVRYRPPVEAAHGEDYFDMLNIFSRNVVLDISRSLRFLNCATLTLYAGKPKAIIAN